MSAADLAAPMVYHCGVLPADGSVPRWTATAAHTGALDVGGTRLSHVVISVASYNVASSASSAETPSDAAAVGSGPTEGTTATSSSQIALAGVVSGTVVAGASKGTVAGFFFDTRDGSWSAAVEFSYSSDAVEAAVMFATASACTAQGAVGSGSLSITFAEQSGGGGGGLGGVVGAVKRCGKFAEEDGTYDFAVKGVSGELALDAGGVVVRVTDAQLTLHAATSTTSKPEPGFGDYLWKGKISADEVSIHLVSAGLTLTGSAEVVFTVSKGQPALKQLTAAVVLSYANGPVSLGGPVAVNWPCAASRPLIKGVVSLNINTEHVTVVDGSAKVGAPVQVDPGLTPLAFNT